MKESHGGTDVGVSSSHAEALGELEGLTHLASAGVDVVDLVSVGLACLSAMKSCVQKVACLTGTLR